jgi:hypothetical protein
MLSDTPHVVGCGCVKAKLVIAQYLIATPPAQHLNGRRRFKKEGLRLIPGPTVRYSPLLLSAVAT